MKYIRDFVISVSEPSVTNVGWIQPQNDGTYKLFIYGGNGWSSFASDETNSSGFEFVHDIALIKAKLNEIYEITQANQEIISSITEQVSKNLYDGTVLSGYVNSTGGYSATPSEQTYKSTGFIPVKPNTYYYISGRKELTITNIRCLDENKQNPTKVKQGSTGEENSDSWYTPGGANSQILTSETAAFIQFNIQFSTVHSDFDKIMVELVGDTYNPSFAPSAYQPYKLEYKITEKALPDRMLI